jgi:chromosome segregation ATPase
MTSIPSHASQFRPPQETTEPADPPETSDAPHSDLPPLPSGGDSFLLDSEHSAINEKEMQRKLMDVESSFLPEAEPVATVEAPPAGADDTYLFGGSPGNVRKASGLNLQGHGHPSSDALDSQDEPETPADAYKTPAVRRDASGDEDDDTSNPDVTTSSPAAAAARRTQSRNVSAEGEYTGEKTGDELQPRRPSSKASKASTVKANQTHESGEEDSSPAGHMLQVPDAEGPPIISTGLPSRLKKRPSLIRHRQSSQRSSTSSFTNQSEISEDPSEGNAADFALQSGGAAAGPRHRQTSGLSRLPSFGSVASGVSAYSDFGSRNVSAAAGFPGDLALSPLSEEDRGALGSPPLTPKPPDTVSLGPTDTVVAQHVRNIQVPDTIAKEYREKHSRSPSKRGTLATPMTTRTKGNLTLKEQNSKIDKLSKENFDLKLKIHFLDQALQNRSDEGVKEMISKNVQLQTDLANERKESSSLRRKVRDLERRLKSQEDGMAAARDASAEDDKGDGEDSPRYAELEEEITYLREILEQSEIETERLREENLAKEADKRRLAEFVKSMGDRRSSEPGQAGEEEIEMWRDLLDTETARREQADQEIEGLREEIRQLKAEANPAAQNHIRNTSNISKKHYTTYLTRHQTGGSDSAADHNTTTSSTLSTLVDQLKHENAELRRDLGAQTSMLTSRNRERERLQEEIESLKLYNRRGDGVRSAAGDSIFDRSVSRAQQRPTSRQSAGTKASQLSDAEREDFERKQDALRDEISQTKLMNQELERELNAHLDLYDQAQAELREIQNERDLGIQDLQALQKERDDALIALQQKENEYEDLKEEAEVEIDNLESELQQKDQDIDQLSRDIEALEQELSNSREDFDGLQQELKQVSESLVRLEDDQITSQQKIQRLQQELDDANKELETLDQRLQETSSKNERYEIQLESSQSEISFLREEQETDKIKIGELEATVAAHEASIQYEKDHAKELQEQMEQEREQREIITNKEKDDVQKVIDELNQKTTKSKEEVRRLRKSLSTKEVEASEWKQRLDELENSLREALGDLNGTRTTLLKVRFYSLMNPLNFY